MVGAASVDSFGPRLPFLLKILAADQPLSLQAHPSREQAEAGYAREQEAGMPRDAPNRIYRDGWPKPEVLCALRDTEALCGFRDPAETYALFRSSASRRRRAGRAAGRRRRARGERLELVFERLLRLEV